MEKDVVVVDTNVHHPVHYNTGKYEAIDVIEDWELGFNVGNTVKYISRYKHKAKPVEDLIKAWWYLTRELLSIHLVTVVRLGGMVATIVKTEKLPPKN